MRILQFGRFHNEQQNGGVERHQQLLCKGLAANGLDVVYLVAAAGLEEKDEIVDGYRLIQAPSFGTLFSTAVSPSQVLRALALHKEMPFDVLHLHFPNPLAHLASMLFPSNVKRVITWHSDIVKQKRLLAMYRPFLQSVTRRADALIAATSAHYSSSTQIPKDISPEKRRVIPFGLDFSSLDLTPHSESVRKNLLSHANGQAIIFALGRHVYYKGFDVLITAMEHINAQLILGGDGPLRTQLESQVDRLGLKHKITFTGGIAEEDLAAYFHACDVFCLPSVEQSEAFGLVQLEAMACGKPVICTQLNNGVNVLNVHGETGFAVPVRDSLALAERINQLLQDSALRLKLGAQAHARALQVYSLDANTQQHIQLYKELTQFKAI
ncbi:MAG TPA: glycosyltransferase [Burkholderiaceae bacterium]|nr:glycosyltransferase [Burkholderiaceae bacterium]